MKTYQRVCLCVCPSNSGNVGQHFSPERITDAHQFSGFYFLHAERFLFFLFFKKKISFFSSISNFLQMSALFPPTKEGRKAGEGLLLLLWSLVAFSGPAIKPNEAAVDKQITVVSRGVPASLGDVLSQMDEEVAGGGGLKMGAFFSA